MDSTQIGFAIMQAASQRWSGLKLRFEAMPWLRCLRDVAAGEQDAVMGASITAERASTMVFPALADGSEDRSKRMYSLGYVLLRPRGSSLSWDGQQFRNLQGALGAQHGYSIAEHVRAMGLKVDDGALTAAALLKKFELGRVEGLLMSQSHMAGRTTPPEWPEGAELAGPPLLQKNYFLAFSKAFMQQYASQARQLWQAVEQARDSEDMRRRFVLND
ncbi:substrate-binding periplasmic protein [Paucibacter soli]|uniref:substrate-binding periplasmic protein n=1 Tax=Paucibacter soli TaxID=3133433 RepID=UPI0030A7E904